MRIGNIMIVLAILLALGISAGAALAAQLPDQNSPRNITFTDSSGVKNASIIQFNDGTSATSWSTYLTSAVFSAYQALVHANFTSLGAADSALTTRVNTVNASALATDARVTTINSTYLSADSALTTRINTLNSSYLAADSALTTRVDTVNASSLATDARVTTINSTYLAADSALTTRVNTVNTTVQNLLTSNTSTGSTIGGLYTNVTALQGAGGGTNYQNVTDLQTSNTSTNYLVRNTTVQWLLSETTINSTNDYTNNSIHLTNISNSNLPTYDPVRRAYIFDNYQRGFVTAATQNTSAINFTDTNSWTLMIDFVQYSCINQNNTGLIGKSFRFGLSMSTSCAAQAGMRNSTFASDTGIQSTASFGANVRTMGFLRYNHTTKNLSIFINNTLAASKIVTVTAVNDSTTTAFDVQGIAVCDKNGAVAGNTQPLNGTCYQAAAWNKALSQEEVTMTYFSGPSTDSLVAWWPFYQSIERGQYDNITALQAASTAITARVNTVNTTTQNLLTSNTSVYGILASLATNSSNVAAGNNTTYRIDGSLQKARIAQGAWNATSDVTGNGYALTQYGAVVYDPVNEWFNWGGSLDATIDTLNLSAPITGFTSTGSTVALWVYANTSTHRNRVFTANAFSTMYYESGATTIVWFCGNGTSYSAGASATSAVIYNTWQHYAVTNDGTTCSFWRNGAVISTQASVGIGNMSTSNPTFNIGGGAADGHNGSIDDVRVYNRSLTLTDVQQLAANGSVLADLKAWYPFTTTVDFGQYQNITALQNAGGQYQNVTDLQTSNTSTNTRINTVNTTVQNLLTSNTSTNTRIDNLNTSTAANISALSTFAQTKAATGSTTCANGTFAQNITLTNGSFTAQCAVDFGGTTGGGSGGGSMDYFTVTNESGSLNNVNITNGSIMRLYGGTGIRVNRTTDDFTFAIDATVLTNTSLTTGLINTTLLNATNSPVTGYVPAYNGTDDQFTWVPAGTGSGTIDGTGRAGAYAQWTDTDSLNSSGIFQNGSVFLVGNATADVGANYGQAMEVSVANKRAYLTINDNTGEGSSLHLRSLTEDFDILNNGTHLRFQYENRSFMNASGSTGQVTFNNTLFVNEGTVLTNTTVSTGLINTTLLNTTNSATADYCLKAVGSNDQLYYATCGTGGSGIIVDNGTHASLGTNSFNATLNIQSTNNVDNFDNQSQYHLMLRSTVDTNGRDIGIGFVDSSNAVGGTVGAAWVYTRAGSNGYGNLSAYTKGSGTNNTKRLTISDNGSVNIFGLTNCDTIDTDANGLLQCGTDATGGGGFTYSDYFDQTLNRSSVINASRFSAAVGSVAAPAITTNLNNDSGIFFLTDGTTGFSNDGAKTFQCNADGCQVPSGGTVFTGIQSTGDDDTGLSWIDGDVLAAVAGGNAGGGKVATFSTNGMNVTKTISAGTAAMELPVVWPVGEYAVLYEDEFMNCNANLRDSLLGAAVSSGTLVASSGGTSTSFIGTCALTDSTTAVGGYNIAGELNSTLIAGGEYGVFVFSPGQNRHSGTSKEDAYFGFADNTAAASLPVDSCAFRRLNYNWSGVCTSNSATTHTATNFSSFMYDAGWYVGTFRVNSGATSVNFSIYNASTGSLLWSNTVASNIPTGAGRWTTPKIIVAENSTNAAVDMISFDYARIGIDRNLGRMPW
jgi:hypothetical protein